MILNRMALGLSVAMMFAGVGCNGDDPLTGSWKNTACFGAKATPAGIKSCSTELSFTDDLEFSIKAQQFSEPATATAPGCTTTRVVNSQTWSTDGDTFTLSGDGTATAERTGCVNASDEFKSVVTVDIVVRAGASGYVITDNSLTIATGDLAGTYTR